MNENLTKAAEKAAEFSKEGLKKGAALAGEGINLTGDLAEKLDITEGPLEPPIDSKVGTALDILTFPSDKLITKPINKLITARLELLPPTARAQAEALSSSARLGIRALGGAMISLVGMRWAGGVGWDVIETAIDAARGTVGGFRGILSGAGDLWENPSLETLLNSGDTVEPGIAQRVGGQAVDFAGGAVEHGTDIFESAKDMPFGDGAVSRGSFLLGSGYALSAVGRREVDTVRLEKVSGVDEFDERLDDIDKFINDLLDRDEDLDIKKSGGGKTETMTVNAEALNRLVDEGRISKDSVEYRALSALKFTNDLDANKVTYSGYLPKDVVARWSERKGAGQFIHNKVGEAASKIIGEDKKSYRKWRQEVNKAKKEKLEERVTGKAQRIQAVAQRRGHMSERRLDRLGRQRERLQNRADKYDKRAGIHLSRLQSKEERKKRRKELFSRG